MYTERSQKTQPSSSRKFNRQIRPSVLLSNRYAILYDKNEVTDDQIPLQFDVPGDGSCLFWSVTLAYLIPVIDDDVLFQLRYKDLFGNDETVATKLTCVKASIRNYNPLSHCVPKGDVLENLVRNTFRNRVVDFMESNLERFECFSELANEQYRLNIRNPDTWSGDPEIQAISLILNCRINVNGQIFPVISNNEELTHEPKRIILWLFHVNRSTGDAHYANHYNYGLDEKLLESFQERLVHDAFNLLKKLLVEKTEVHRQERNADYHYNDDGYNLSDKLNVCDAALEKDAGDIASIIGSKVAHRINSEARLEDVCFHELVKILEEHKDLKQANQPEDKDSNENIYRLFQNPKHVANVFRTLKDMPEKFELLKCAFVVLKAVIHELYSHGNYDLVIMIANVEEVVSIKNTILQKDTSDLDALQFQRIIAQTKMKKLEPKDAHEILNGIMNKIMHPKDSIAPEKLSVEEIESCKFDFSLLILSDIAFTKHLMDKCKESYNEYKDLYEKIMDHLGINCVEGRLTYEIYREISQSVKYKSILALHRQYLNIFHIREGIAHELLCLGVQMRDSLWKKNVKYCNGTFNEIVKCVQDAINLQKDNFEIKRIDAEFRQDAGMNMRNIAIGYKMLGDFKGFHKQNVGQNQTISNVNEALNCYYKTLEMLSVSLTSPELWSTNPANSQFFKEIALVLKRISLFHSDCGSLIKDDPEAALQNFEKALYIAEELHNFPVLLEYLEGKTYNYHWSRIQNHRKFIHTKLCNLKSKDSPAEASRHYKKAREIDEYLGKIGSMRKNKNQEDYQNRSFNIIIEKIE